MLVVVLHSMYGLRDVERAAAATLRAAGHDVVVPDLYGGLTSAPVVADGLELMRSVGWQTIVSRARAATADLPADAALIGFSMGVGVLGALWPDRPQAPVVVCWHAATVVPGTATSRTVQLHVATDDPFAPREDRDAFARSAAAAGAPFEEFRYPGGHFFTDPAGPDWQADSARLSWERALAALAG
ncbi:dienelactone hydrolase family protein [Leifsonia sp. ku-ls]|nr:dienelactone hydrolase family protein [Leifsonia sp. ku-ls]